VSDATAADVLRVRRLRDDAVVPTRAHDGDAGLDLVATDRAELAPGGGRAVVGTGIAVEVPHGFAGLVCPRSGLAARHGIGVVNGPGVVDAGYRGEVRVVLCNTDPSEPFVVEPGDRIAQLVLVPVALPGVEEVGELSVATRDAAGFGSTGGFG
jgi:dUTP pyrophosphatase